MPRCLCCSEKFEKKYKSQQGRFKFCLLKEECIAEWRKVRREYEEAENKKAWNKEKRERKQSLKTKQNYESELEVIFNKWIRLRDVNEPCISCDKAAGQYKDSAGHLWPAGQYKNIRFNEDNVHSQCWYDCNKNKHGNVNEYRRRVVKKIGKGRLKELDRLSQIPLKLTIPEIILMKEEYKERIRRL